MVAWWRCATPESPTGRNWGPRGRPGRCSSRVCVGSFIPRGAFEDLAAVPGDVDDVHFRLARSRDEQRLARELIHRPACLVPGDVQSGYADPPFLGDADDTQV